LLVLSFVLSVSVGASGFTPLDLFHSFRAARAAPDGHLALARTVLLSIRLPRTLTAGLTGGALAAAGVASQGLFRNALASPSVLGTEAGGSFGAVLLFYFGAAYWHWLSLPLAAFVGALGATAFIFVLAARGPTRTIEFLLLAGFAVNALAGALSSLVVSLSLEDYQKTGAIMHWLLGGFAGKGWEHVWMAAPPMVAGFALVIWLAPRLDVLALGEDVAASLSVDMRFLRRASIVAIAVLVGTAVAVAGAIPFVGLVVPHFTRLIAGPQHRRLVWLSTINGMSLVMLADLVARTIRAPAEIEVGILTSLIGAPFFLVLLLSQKKGQIG